MTPEDPINRSPAAPRSRLLVVIDILMFLLVVAMPLAWLFDPLRISLGPLNTSMRWGWKPVAIPLAILVVRQWLARRGPHRGLAESALYRKSAFAIVSTLGFLLLAEVMLGWAGVKTEASPIVIRGEEATDTKEEGGVVADPEVLWRFKRHGSWDRMAINSHGYRTREVALHKPAGTRRVVALGDSCTAQGHPPYSDVLHDLLQRQPPTAEAWESFNLGVFGYSIMQGYRIFEKDALAFEPDVVTLYFGWNDHWLHVKPDHLRMAVRMSPLAAATTEGLHRKRIFAALASLQRGGKAAENKPGADYRVPPELYRATLAELIKAIRKAGARPLVITAPRRELSEELVRSGHARTPDESEQVHDQYVAITREVAAAEGAGLLDLAAQFAGPEHDALFSRDGIHFEQAGIDAIAAAIHGKLMEMGARGELAR